MRLSPKEDPKYLDFNKLKHITNRIKLWNKEIFGNILKDKKDLEKLMEELQQNIIQNGITNQMKQEEKDLQ